MPPIENDLQTGIATARAGKKDQARTLLMQVLKAEPHNETAWLWLSYCMPTLEQALRCIDHLLTINPQHQRALEARDVLHIRLLLEESSMFSKPTTPIASTPQRRYLLGEALLEARVINQKQLEKALQEQARLARKNKPKRLGEILIGMKAVRPEQIEGAIAAQIEALPTSQTSGTMGRIGEFLVERGLITAPQLHQGLAQQADLRRRGKPAQLGDILVRCGYIQRDQLNRAVLDWQQQYETYFY